MIDSLTRPSQRALWRIWGLVLASVLALGPHAALAQDVAALQGTFAWDATASDDVTESIEAATADLGFMHRAFARGHLQRSNQPYRTITIEQDEETVTIATDGDAPLRAPASGEPVSWTRGDGEQVRVRIAREDGAIRQTIISADGECENVFRPHADGQGLALAVTVRIDRLPAPIRYELVYRRQPGGPN